MLKSNLFGLFLLAFWISSALNFLWGQERPVLFTLEVRVYESFRPIKRPIQNVRVELTTKKKEVICSGITDSLGAVFFDHNCVKSDLDTIIIKFYRGNDYLSWDDREFIPRLITKGEKRSFDFINEIQLIRPCIDFSHPVDVQCQINNAELFFDFEPEHLKKLLQEHPSLCLQIVQTKHPEETDELATRRMKNFEVFMKDAGVDMSRLTFAYDFYTIPKERLIKVPLPKIEFVISSYDCGK